MERLLFVLQNFNKASIREKCKALAQVECVKGQFEKLGKFIMQCTFLYYQWARTDTSQYACENGANFWTFV